jgi:hypothetical protein
VGGGWVGGGKSQNKQPKNDKGKGMRETVAEQVNRASFLPGGEPPTSVSARKRTCPEAQHSSSKSSGLSRACPGHKSRGQKTDNIHP